MINRKLQMSRNYLRNEMITHIFFFFFMLILSVFFFMISSKNLLNLFLSFLFFSISILFLIQIRTYRCILKQFRLLEINLAGQAKEEASIYKPKIRFLAFAKFRHGFYRAKADTMFFGFIIIDHTKKKYYYIFEDAICLNNHDLKKIQEKLDRRFSIQYYRGTSIIYTIENNPHFLHMFLHL